MTYKSEKATYNPKLDTCDYSEYSAKKLVSNNIPLLLVGLSVFACNAATLIFFIVQGFNAATLTAVIVLLALDAGHFLAARVTNYRFRYGKKLTALYVTVSAVWTVVTAAVCFNPAGRIYVFGVFALIVFLATRVGLYALVLYGAQLAKNSSKGLKGTVGAVGTAAVLLLCAVLFCSFFGFFGQSAPGDSRRAVQYVSVTENGETYYAADKVLAGTGGSVTIPRLFNGVPVRKIDARVFAASGVKTILLESEEVLELTNGHDTRSINGGLSVLTDRSLVDVYKQTFFKTAQRLSYPQKDALCAAVVPVVQSDEIYVSFRYDSDAMPSALRTEAVFVPTFIAKRGETLSSSRLGPYEERYERRNDAEWNWKNNERFVLMPPSLHDGNPLIGTPIGSSEVVDFSFTPLYKVNVSKGPGSLFKPTAWTDVQYISVVNNPIDLAALTAQRPGCTARWTASVLASRQEITSREELLNFLSKIGMNQYECALSPEWTLVKPDLAPLSSNSPDNRFTYGDDVILSCRAETHALPIRYSLEESAPLAQFQNVEESIFDLGKLTPLFGSKRYAYTLTAAVTDRFDPSMTASAIRKCEVTVEAKPIDFSWDVPADPTYDNTDKAVGCTFDPSQLVDDDRIEFDFSPKSVRNAGNYVCSVWLSSGDTQNYRIGESSDKQIRVTPRALTAEWSVPEFVYNGRTQCPEAAVTALPGDSAPYDIIGGQTDAGTYTAEISSRNSNYVFTNPTLSYTIQKAPASVIWGVSSFTYTGRAMAPTAGITDAFGDMRTLSVSGAQTNAGSYTATASDGSGNYQLDGAVKSFTVLPKPVTVVWSDTSLTYNGKKQTPAARFNGVSGSPVALTVTGGQTDAGSYTVSAACSDTNYSLNGAAVSFTILPKPVTVVWNDTSLVYDGSLQKPSARYTDALNRKVVPKVTGAGTDAGNYTATALNDDGNYTFINPDRTFSIAPKSVSVTWDKTSFRLSDSPNRPTALNLAGVGGVSYRLYDGAGALVQSVARTGSYRIVVTATDKNYQLTNTECAFTVN